MNENKYVNSIVRRIQCGGKKRKEIKKELLTDIQCRLNEGEELSSVLDQMGAIGSVASDFNCSLTKQDRKNYKRELIMKIVLILIAAMVLVIGGFYLIMPKTRDIAKSEYFTEEQVSDAMRHTVELLDADDFEALQETANDAMKEVVTKEVIDSARTNIVSDFGERQSFGKTYIVELVQKNNYYALGEITVTYENTTVTYRLTYDSDMKLAGLFIR